MSDFFQPLHSEMLRLLSKEPILESFAGVFTKPSSLRYVPANFSDDNGKPLFCSNQAKLIYICPKYSLDDASELSRIGVKELTAEEFLADLQIFIRENTQVFRRKSPLWHSRLCKVLTRIVNENSKMKLVVSALEIVPLREGRWVSSDMKNIYLPSDSDSLVVPNGLEVREIDPQAVKAENRRTLFILLGAKGLSKDLVCGAIVKMHTQNGFKSKPHDSEELISHITFLYKANWRNTSRHDLWFVTKSESIQHGSELYLDSNDPYSASSLFAEYRKKFSFLHKGYGRLTSLEDNHYRNWFLNELHIAEYPRLVSLVNSSELSLSKDFHFLMEKCSSQQVLLLLKIHWSHYSMWFIPGKGSSIKKFSNDKLKTSVSSMRVRCRGGAMAQLKHTILPQSDTSRGKITTMQFLDVPEPMDPRWRYLNYFGVVTEPGSAPFIQCLRQMRGSNASVEKVGEIYEHLHSQSRRERESIR